MKWSKWMKASVLGVFGILIAVIVMSTSTMAKEKCKTFEKTTYSTIVQSDPNVCVCETQMSAPEVATISVVSAPVLQTQTVVSKTHYTRTEPLRRIPRHLSSTYLRTSHVTSGAAYQVVEKKTRTVWKN